MGARVSAVTGSVVLTGRESRGAVGLRWTATIKYLAGAGRESRSWAVFRRRAGRGPFLRIARERQIARAAAGLAGPWASFFIFSHSFLFQKHLAKFLAIFNAVLC